jgi:L-serine deaminase
MDQCERTHMKPENKDMNAKYEETSEGGLAVSLVLC